MVKSVAYIEEESAWKIIVKTYFFDAKIYIEILNPNAELKKYDVIILGYLKNYVSYYERIKEKNLEAKIIIFGDNRIKAKLEKELKEQESINPELVKEIRQKISFYNRDAEKLHEVLKNIVEECK